MKYWNEDEILERDVIEGEAIFDSTNPHPAYRGTRLLSIGVDRLYEVEIVPGTCRMEAIIDPSTFNSIVGNIVDILYRKWDDDTHQWIEIKMPSLLSAWGYDDIPTNDKIKKLTAFDKAMKGI